MYCEKCGAPIEAEDKFCPYCGAKNMEPNSPIDFGNPQEATGYSYVNEPYPPTPPAKKSNGKIIALVIAIVAVVIAIVAVVFIFVGKDIISNNNITDEDVNNTVSTTAPADDFNIDSDENTVISDEDATTAEDFNLSTQPTYESEVQQPDKYYNEVTYYITNINGVSLQQKPYPGSLTLGMINCNGAVIVKGGMQNDESWVYVYCASLSSYGWIPVSAITPTAPTPDVPAISHYDEAAQYSARISVGEGHNLNLRETPIEDADNVILLIPNNAVVTVIGISNMNSKWLYVQYRPTGPDGQFETIYGFVHSDYVDRF